VSRLVYELANGRRAIDCPRCGQAARVDSRGKSFSFHCYGGCANSELAGSLDPAVLVELAATAPENGGPSADWLEGEPMDPTATPAEPLRTIPGVPFLHAGTAAVISGPTGAGRSSLIQAGLYDSARAGTGAAYLGSEVTLPEFNARAADLARGVGSGLTRICKPSWPGSGI
jgi:hypothetical protein